eukprot:11228217-Lingulodinium_polyedra.AAC.1
MSGQEGQTHQILTPMTPTCGCGNITRGIATTSARTSRGAPLAEESRREQERAERNRREQKRADGSRREQ